MKLKKWHFKWYKGFLIIIKFVKPVSLLWVGMMSDYFTFRMIPITPLAICRHIFSREKFRKKLTNQIVCPECGNMDIECIDGMPSCMICNISWDKNEFIRGFRFMGFAFRKASHGKT